MKIPYKLNGDMKKVTKIDQPNKKRTKFTQLQEKRTKLTQLPKKRTKFTQLPEKCTKSTQLQKFFTKTTQPVKPRGPLESHLYPLVGYPFKYSGSSTSSPFSTMVADKEEYLKSIYYDVSHPASCSGLDRLYREVKKEGWFQLTRKELKAWLKTQETYGKKEI